MANNLGTQDPVTQPTPDDRHNELDPRATAVLFEPDAMEPIYPSTLQQYDTPRGYPYTMDTDEHWDVTRSQQRLVSTRQPSVALNHDDYSSVI